VRPGTGRNAGVSSARHYDEDAHSGAGYRDAPNRVPTAPHADLVAGDLREFFAGLD
jgi:hypothetical protein